MIALDTQLTPWPNDLLKLWDSLSADAKKLFIRQVEVFAAYAAYNDHEIGRVMKAFEDAGRLDNTLIIYINGDNGTSAEGGPLGTPNEVAFFNGLNELPLMCKCNGTTCGAPRKPTTICLPAGPGPLTPPLTGSSRTPPGSAASTRTWWCRGRADQRQGRITAAVCARD